MDFCSETEKLWRLYFSPDPARKRTVLDMLDPECVVIGTGADELYHQLSDFIPAMEREFAEQVEFQFKDLWCREKRLGEDACLTYGGIHVWWESPDGKILIDMDSRFTILYRRRGERWRVVHIHHSVPNEEQMEGEFYPKTLLSQVKEARDEADHMRVLAQRDALTGLYNYRSLEKHWLQWDQPGSWFFLLDVDDFKQVNDTYGHMTGNEVLKQVAQVLEGAVRAGDKVYRLGGDEFGLLCGGVGGEDEARCLAKRLLRSLNQAGEGQIFWTSVSIGGTAVRRGEPMERMLKRADDALYQRKRSAKNGYRFYQEKMSG